MILHVNNITKNLFLGGGENRRILPHLSMAKTKIGKSK